MGAPQPQAGWYPDPATGQQRYFDGTQWLSVPPPPGAQPASAPPQTAGVIVTGPNHALHLILSILTFWACGGWIWIWLIVALSNTKQVRAVDAYGNPIVRPQAPRAPREAAKRMLVTAEGVPDWTMRLIVGAVIASALIVLIIALAAAH